ncbi:hypothetical protein LTR10_013233 [Elasticomyces elasticus]|uniref:Uncharacterized protein n=1 Tax=Exophiala sideris TaxID=1016849 RepID=A0ABR0JBG9_9EURO|nr:hypothetical protein LTR10_013233 [Elasticomyces elasticus]KAK5030612.1 hypothetical protein LTS07_005396 [Exophiala sideris]KAK5038666.1 hypothetical protein LTR13_004413 [Exophiala sideris]KAK5060547.1 hypothetical protein LTR69_005864 [Exophiala sideris]KAK5183459.1 hypothetical protein LTR44_004460 [Eurotiomycetes sp. CCFEE 6388]
MAKSQPRCSLQDTVNKGNFFLTDETTILFQIKEAFEPELERLKSAKAVEGTEQERYSNGTLDNPSPSQILYGTNFDEINRTLVGILALRWINNKDYDRFTRGQPTETRLCEDSFAWLCRLFSEGLKCSDDLFALVLSMVINDLGKDPDLEEDLFHQTGQTLSAQNHDALLLEAANAGMIPSLNYLAPDKREEVMLGLELGSELNAGQLAQAESVPINLEGLLHMRGHEHAFDLKFMEQILDVAGAAGHLDSSGAKNLIEPVFQAFKTVHEVSLDIIAGNANLRQGYDKILTKRGNMLWGKGFRRLSVSDQKERALLRILAMGRTADKEQAELFCEAFDALDNASKDQLIQGLNIDGKVNETAVLPYYMPAIISTTLQNTKDSDKDSKQRALTSLMRYLARVLGSPGAGMVEFEDRQYNTEVPGIVIERNMSKAQDMINSPEFKDDPNILNSLEIPPGQVLQRRQTSQSW